MVIGIVGRGKMGLDLFNLIIEYDYKVVLIGRAIDDNIVKKFKNTLARKVKHNLITKEHMEKMLDNICITSDYKKLKLCDIVFETVIEDLNVKQEVFKKIEDNVSSSCILATNSSSYQVDDIFDRIANKKRCMGIHFFYPMKIVKIVEINELVESDNIYIKKAEKFLSDIDRKVLLLSDNGKLILSKILTTLAAVVFNECKENNCQITQMDSLIKEKLMIFGVFEIVDSTGFKIIKNCLINFSDERHNSIYKQLYNKTIELEEKGYYGQSNGKGYLIAEAEGICVIDEEKKMQKSNYEIALLNIKAIMLNEIAHIGNNIIKNNPFFLEAIEEALGLKVSLKEMYFEIQDKKIEEILYKKNKKEGQALYVKEKYDIYE